MVKIDLQGIAKVTAKGRVYYYAWRGGPRLRGKPGSPEFIASYNEAHENRRTLDDGRFRSLVVLYRASDAYKELAASTKRNWAPWLDRLADHFGELRVAQFDRPEKIKPIIRKWRNKYAKTPRTADYGLQVLSRVLKHAVELGKIASNPCEGIEQLYTVNRSEKIWTDADISRLKAACSPEIGFAVDLAAATGLRMGDLLRLCWSHVHDDAIIIATGKSRFRREAIVPLYDDLRDLLARIPKRSTTILTNKQGRPWRDFSSTFSKLMKSVGLNETGLHFHDLRGTAATRFYTAGLSERVIAEIMGWEEEHVAKIIRRYVGRAAATKEIIRQLNERRT
jgi:integrase